MRLLADENQHPVIVTRLRAPGHTVEWIRETSRRVIDEVILNRPDIVADRLLSLIERGGIEGHIITITKDGERWKPFPTGA